MTIIENDREHARELLALARNAGWRSVSVRINPSTCRWEVKGVPPWSYRGQVDVTVRDATLLTSRPPVV